MEEKSLLKKLKSGNVNKALIIIMFLFIGFGILSFTLMLKDYKKNTECSNDPFAYVTKKTKDQGMEIICRCTPLDPKYAPFSFGEGGIAVGEKSDYLDFDVSKLE